MKKIAVIFGGQSSEHEVSCVSATTIIKNIDKSKYELVLIGITQDGRWRLVEDVSQIEHNTWRESLVDAIISPDSSDHGIIISNPVYGERIGDQEQKDEVFAAIARFMKRRPDWSVFLITPDKKTEEKTAGRRADRRRKLYNGNIEVCYYQFHGEK